MAWRDRPREEAHLLNPGFLGLVMWSAAAGFHEATQAGLPFHLAFVVAPVSLHKATREALPPSSRTSLAAWIEENAVFRVGFAERARSLSPFVRDALLFGAAQGLLSVGDGGRIEPAPRPRAFARYLRESSDEVHDCVKKAGFAAKWFALAGSPATVMALWGVKP